MDARQYLYSLESLGIKFGLENIRAICAALGDPHLASPTLIVAGTNGKGSVAAMVERGLRAAGLRTGLYTSPHLVRLEERFAIGGASVAPGELDEAAGRVRDVIGGLRAAGRLPADPTFFEATTAAAFEIFRRAGAEVTVLEVGLGGRFDATNVAAPIAGAITTVDLDHEALLGRWIPDIAFEKAGVIKAGMAVVIGETKPEAVGVITRVASERGARLVPVDEGTTLAARLDRGDTVLELHTPVRDYGTLRLSLRGLHQARNAAVAVRLLETLPGLGLAVPEPAIRAAVTDVRWPGRLDLVAVPGGRLLLDAAHNPAGARVLADYLRATWPGGLPIVFGAMRDKDLPGMLAAVLPSATLLVATAARTARAAPPEAVADAARRLAPVPVWTAADPADAVARALATAPAACVAGSIYLVGEVLAAFGSMAP